MPLTLAEIRERRRQHEEEIVSVRWLTPADLAARWKISLSSIYAIPADQLEYKTFGQGVKHKRRRYREEWVLSYENLK